MAAVTLTQDILALCLLFADGKISLSMEEIVRRAERYQEKHDRHFGISRSDLRVLFIMLLSPWYLGIRGFSEELDDIKLSDIIFGILKYHDAHFNDEGSHWITYEDARPQANSSLLYWLGYDENQYQEKLDLKEKMTGFFQEISPESIDAESVRDFMSENNITEDILFHVSRPGGRC
jgi:hypothetical protein